MLLIESNANHFHILFSSCFLLPSSCSARFTCLAVRLLLSPFALAFLRPFSRSARFTRLAHPPRPVFRGQPFLHHPCFPVKDIPALTFFQEQETTRERAPERARFLICTILAVPILAVPVLAVVQVGLYHCLFKSVFSVCLRVSWSQVALLRYEDDFGYRLS